MIILQKNKSIWYEIFKETVEMIPESCKKGRRLLDSSYDFK